SALTDHVMMRDLEAEDGPTVGVEGLALALGWLFGRRDRLHLMFDARDFSVSENIAILHDTMELFSNQGGGRVLPTPHTAPVPDAFGGKRAASHTTVLGDGGAAERRDTEKKGKLLDRGKKDLGTRDEKSADTRAARKHHMPVEAGRSHTAGRLFEMVDLMRP